MIRHVVFDMDGTLADTAKVTIPACAEASRRFGLAQLTEDEIKAAIGYANPAFYFRLYPNVERETVFSYGEAVEALEEKIVWGMGEALLFAGIKETLLALAGRDIRLYVASTGDQGHVDAVLKTTGIEHFFAQIACGEPEKVEMVAKIIGETDPRTFAMVGDKPHDLNAARGNGILALAAGYGYCSPEDAAKFDGVLHAPMHILEWL